MLGGFHERIRRLLQEDIDPTKETSSVGKALRALRDLLDAKRNDSIQGSLDAAVRQVTADSGPLAKAVKDVVAEARDRQHPLGRMAISDTVSTAMAERSASAAIYVSKTRDGLAKEIGEWAEGVAAQGRWVACAHEHLITAVRFLVAQERLQAIRAATPSLDAASIEAQIQRIRTTLGRIKTINTKITDLRGSADEIQHEAEAVRDEIRDALSDVEDALRGSRADSAPSS